MRRARPLHLAKRPPPQFRSLPHCPPWDRPGGIVDAACRTWRSAAVEVPRMPLPKPFSLPPSQR
eukprot:5836722-Prymnesium_polylepis.1